MERSQKHIDRFWSKLIFPNDPDNECWDYSGYKNKDGYGRFGIDNVMYLAHRYSYHIHFWIKDMANEICHTCDNPGCCNPKHLFESDHKGNMDERDQKGRVAKGEKSGQSKLTHFDILTIRHRSYCGETATEIANDYIVGTIEISRIIRGKTWKHVDGPLTENNATMGSQRKNSKLTEDDVREIRRLAKTTTQAELCRIYDIGSGNMSNIINHKAWKHVK